MSRETLEEALTMLDRAVSALEVAQRGALSPDRSKGERLRREVAAVVAELDELLGARG